MSTHYKALCGSECCTISQDMQEDLNAFQRKFLKELKAELKGMHAGRHKRAFLMQVEEYEREIIMDGKPIHSRLWSACDSIGCAKRKVPNTKIELPHFGCVIGDCKDCGIFKVPKMELRCDRMISFFTMSSHVHCNGMVLTI